MHYLKKLRYDKKEFDAHTHIHGQPGFTSFTLHNYKLVCLAFLLFILIKLKKKLVKRKQRNDTLIYNSFTSQFSDKLHCGCEMSGRMPTGQHQILCIHQFLWHFYYANVSCIFFLKYCYEIFNVIHSVFTPYKRWAG